MVRLAISRTRFLLLFFCSSGLLGAVYRLGRRDNGIRYLDYDESRGIFQHDLDDAGDYIGATVESEVNMPSLTPESRLEILGVIERRISKLQGQKGPVHRANMENLQAIMGCLEQGELFSLDSTALGQHEMSRHCSRKLKVTILHYDYCSGYLEGLVRGEDVWCGSYVKSLERLGYSYFVTSGKDEKGLETAFNELTGALVRNVLVGTAQLRSLMKRQIVANQSRSASGDMYLLKPAIPVELAIVADWWGLRPGKESIHPLGTQWWVTPYEMPGHGYLGYSVEHLCQPDQTVPLSKRTNGVALLAKQRNYLYPVEQVAFSGSDFGEISKALNVTIDSYLGNWEAEKFPLPEGLTNHGILKPGEYAEALRNSVALLGIGSPGSSPTPYLALCMGVPFINPHMRKARPVDEWYMSNNLFQRQEYQHGPLAMHGPPHIYNVEYKDVQGVIDALRQAVVTPIEGWLAPELTDQANDERAARLMARNLWAEAASLLD